MTSQHNTAQTGETFWSAPGDAVLSTLESSRTGLSTAEAVRRLARYGPNRLAPPAAHARLRLLAAQFRSPITLLLVVAAGLSLAVGERIDGAIILGIIVVSGLLGYWQEQRAADAVAALLEMVQTRTTVLRDRKPVQVPVDAVVPGDVVALAAGDTIPGDARILDEKDLFVDEAALTGESFPAEKRVDAVAADAELGDRTSALFFGTHVISGTATAVVVTTGVKTVFGQISSELSRKPPATEFEIGVRHFGYLLLDIAVVMSLAIFAINVAFHRPVLDSLLFTLALAVGLTPQLLPAIVSVTLAEGARRMARAEVIVRRLTSIEDIGGVTILCTDKTGTLTEGVVEIDTAVGVDGAASEKTRLFVYLNALHETGYSNPIDDAIRRTPVAGSEAYRKVDEVPYDFARKRQSVAVADAERVLLITKGALSNILDVCTMAELADGSVVSLEPHRARIQAEFEERSRQGNRCLGVAYRQIESGVPVDTRDERDMVFLGLLCLADPPKSGAIDSLARLKKLGITVKLVTGDNRLVAAKVAGDARLNASKLVTGAEISQLGDAALVRRVRHVSVFAEVDPNQKERIILALKKSGLAVGYLGDGINDAAALHAADVGISVDTAVNVTKQAADIVLLRKDLGVLVDGVREGRRAFANTLKYVFITTSANFGNMFSMAGASLFAEFLPMLPMQILLLNVLSDLPAMAIASDRLDDELVARPRRWNVRSIGQFMMTFGLISSVFDFLTFFTLLALGTSAALFRAGWFQESLLSELLILLVIRTRRPFFKSRPGTVLLVLSVVVAAGSMLLPYLPFAGALGFAPIPLGLWGILAVILGAYVLTSELAKRVFFKRVHL